MASPDMIKDIAGIHTFQFLKIYTSQETRYGKTARSTVCIYRGQKLAGRAGYACDHIFHHRSCFTCYLQDGPQPSRHARGLSPMQTKKDKEVRPFQPWHQETDRDNQVQGIGFQASDLDLVQADANVHHQGTGPYTRTSPKVDPAASRDKAAANIDMLPPINT